MPTFPWRLLCVALTLTVSALALLPQPPEGLTSGWDKANHALAFAALSGTGWLAWPARRAHWLALGWLGYGGLIELLQTQLPPRQGEAADLLADALGIAIGLGAVALGRRLSARAGSRRHKPPGQCAAPPAARPRRAD